jgi:hypothetical protein
MVRQAMLSGNHVIQTAGELFSDGVGLELCRTPSDPTAIKLLSWNGKVGQIARQAHHAGKEYAPLRLDPSIYRALRLPARVAPPEKTSKLFNSLHGLLGEHLRQPDSSITKLVFGVFASWVARVLPMAPILWIFTPAGTPKILLLQLLGLVCRLPLRLVGVRRSDLRSLPLSLEATLLLDEPDTCAAMEGILHASSRRGVYIPSGRGLLDLYGAKMICSRKLPHGTALETEAVRVALVPVTEELSSLDKKTEDAIADEFQSRFLGYFLRNFSSVQVPKFDVSYLTVPFQGVARSLGAAVVGDQQLQEKILPLLTTQDEEVRADQAMAFDSVVLESLLCVIHSGGCSEVRATKMAKKVVDIYRGRGSDRRASAEMVGWALKRLEIPRGRIDSAGNGVKLTEPTCRLVHQLAFAYGVRALQSGFHRNCRFCTELEVTIACPKRLGSR